MVGINSELLTVRIFSNAQGSAASGITVVCPYTLLYKDSITFP